MKRKATFCAVLALALAGCASYTEHAAKRTDQLRQQYPPGLTRDDVQKNWAPTSPDFSALRPAEGWGSHPNRYLSTTIPAIEQRTQAGIHRVDRYWGADGFLSLCYCWYYFGADDKLVDVEWQYKSD